MEKILKEKDKHGLLHFTLIAFVAFAALAQCVCVCEFSFVVLRDKFPDLPIIKLPPCFVKFLFYNEKN